LVQKIVFEFNLSLCRLLYSKNGASSQHKTSLQSPCILSTSEDINPRYESIKQYYYLTKHKYSVACSWASTMMNVWIAQSI